MTTLDTSTPPADARRIEPLKPALLLTQEHHMCPGCGEPLAVRQFLETIEGLGQAGNAVGVAGIGCYTSFSATMDVDLVQALHGRAPSVATGVKRMLPDALVFTLQGDGDMVNEGLQEVIHTAARGERVTCILLNNGVFGETGGHMVSTSTNEKPSPRICASNARVNIFFVRATAPALCTEPRATYAAPSSCAMRSPMRTG